MSTHPEPSVATLGPLGTYSHQATELFFGHDCHVVPCDTIADVFNSVDKGHTPYGLVPIDNSTIGIVLETAEALRSTELSVRGMVALKIGHALLGRASTSSQAVKRVYSHEQGLGQCVKYLAEHYPHAEIVPVTSTAKAAQEAAADPTGLAICSPKCADVYNLDVIDTDIQDGGAANTTRFVALSRHDVPLPDRYPIASRITT